MIKMFSRLKPREWLLTFISLVFIVGQVWLDLSVPFYMAEITRIVTTGGQLSEVLIVGLFMLGATLGSAVASIIIGFVAAHVGASFSQSLRGDLFRRVESFSLDEINKFSTASLITRTTNDITQIQMLVAMGMQLIVRAPIMAVWALSAMAGGNWEWTALTGALVAVVVIMISILMAYALPRFRKIQDLTDNLNLVTRENLTGIRVVRAYNAESFQEKKFDKANEDFTSTSLSVVRAMQIMNPVMRLVMSGLSLGIFWIGAFLIQAATIEGRIDIFANMVVFSQYAMHVIMSFMMLTMILIILPRVMVSVKRVNEVLETEPKILDGHISATPEGVVGEVEFRNVSFKYPDGEDYALYDISFKAERGETVALIGSTGSGKSTIVNLVPRFYDTTQGQVLVNGVDVKDYTQEALRNTLGYVPQKAAIFSGTVSSNVAFGSSGKPQPSENDVRAAVSIAQALPFVEDMENSFEAHIAQGGTNISGGEKQRLSIARAICRRPEIYIFDDSFSALDYKTDKDLRAALQAETQGATCLIVAQRIGTIRGADRILVLDEGRLVGTGTHEILMKSCEVYREIAQSQLSVEELGL
ncbi:MAG: ABC transporter ATP-binding protein/permease [Oscillospiraceae bacterium]|nr:ABC transporter ATP-binding protein/permease [Oscillospiraceae bacterium]